MTNCFYAQDTYLQVPEQYTDPRVSPYLYPDTELTNVCPAFIIGAGCDFLLDEGREYANRLKRLGIDVEYREYSGAVHGFINLPLAEQQFQAQSDWFEAIRRAVQKN